MQMLFYVAGAVAIVSTVMTITRLNAVHALLYLIVSLLSVSVVFYTIGAPFVAALEVIIYAGAIMVLFIFVVMMLNLGERAARMESTWLTPGIWIGPSILSSILTIELVYMLARGGVQNFGARPIGPKEIGIALFGPYAIGVELASMLLLGGLVGAYHLGSRIQEKREIRDDVDTDGTGTGAGGNLVRAGTGRPSRAA
jgi:NADH-quinone oxidoreductase subunit J